MITRGLIAGLMFGFGTLSPVLANDDALRDYDRQSLDFLFEQAQFGGPLSGASEDDMLITGSIGSSDKKIQPSRRDEQRVPVSRPAR